MNPSLTSTSAASSTCMATVYSSHKLQAVQNAFYASISTHPVCSLCRPSDCQAANAHVRRHTAHRLLPGQRHSAPAVLMMMLSRCVQHQQWSCMTEAFCSSSKCQLPASSEPRHARCSATSRRHKPDRRQLVDAQPRHSRTVVTMATGAARAEAGKDYSEFVALAHDLAEAAAGVTTSYFRCHP